MSFYIDSETIEYVKNKPPCFFNKQHFYKQRQAEIGKKQPVECNFDNTARILSFNPFRMFSWEFT